MPSRSFRTITRLEIALAEHLRTASGSGAVRARPSAAEVSRA
jgi:hypothetical protein